MSAILTLAQAAEQGVRCAIHSRCTKTYILHRHHFIPLSWIPVALAAAISNREVVLCPTGHLGQVHYALDDLVRHDGAFTSASSELWQAAKDLALEGFQSALKQGLTPRPTL